MHPDIEEFCRANSGLQMHVFRRLQRVFREELAPKIDRYDQVIAENESLKARVAELESKKRKAGTE